MAEAVARRRLLPKFGLAANGTCVTTRDTCEVHIEPPGQDKSTQILVKQIKTALSRPSRRLPTGRRGRYIPPARRDSNPYENMTCTIRLSNMSLRTLDADVRVLCEAIGPIERVCVPKEKESRQSRGFAFVTFRHRDDAETALRRLHGHCYDHLVVDAHWARPPDTIT